LWGRLQVVQVLELSETEGNPIRFDSILFILLLLFRRFAHGQVYTSCIDLLNRAVATTKFDELKHNWDNIELYASLFLLNYLSFPHFGSSHCMHATFGVSNEIVNLMSSGHWVLLQGAGPDNLYVDGIISVWFNW
jgi:hypothetical protein